MAERSIRPAPASAIARGKSVWAIRRQTWNDSSLRRASGGREAGPVVVRDADEDHPTAGPDCRDGIGDRIVVTGDLEGDIDRHVTTVRAGDDEIGRPATGHEPVRRTHAPGRVDPMGEPIRGHDGRGTTRSQELDQQQAERSTAVDARPGADRDRCEIEGVERDAERLEEGGLVVTDRVRDAIEQVPARASPNEARHR